MMNIDDLTIKQAKELAAMFGGAGENYGNGMVGEYVIVRCRDAGVHAGWLESHHNRECVLTESRRLWRWHAKKGAFLGDVAKYGIDQSKSKIEGECRRLHLTETCEIILCSLEAQNSIRGASNHNE